MSDPERDVISKRFRLVLDLFASGVAIMRQNLRREHPDASDAEIERLVVEWLRARAGAGEDAWSRPRRIVG